MSRYLRMLPGAAVRRGRHAARTSLNLQVWGWLPESLVLATYRRKQREVGPAAISAR